MRPDSGRASAEHVGRVLSLIGGRDLAGLRAELAPLTDGQRREAAAAVDAWSRNLRAEPAPLQGGCSWGEITWPLACAAVVGTFPAPAAAATALLRVDRQCRAFFVPADLMVAMARERGLTWLPDLAGRLAARLGGSPHTWVGLDQILRACHAPAPAGDAFVIGWLSTAARAGNQWRPPGPMPAQQADWLQASPYLRDLLPRVFEAEGAWRELESHESWRGLIELSRREPGYRPLLLDGCLRRILLGGTAPALHPFAMLWPELAPDDDEVAVRIAAYTAVAASAAPRLATRALKALHALERQGRLGLDDLLDLSAAVLARREKTLAGAQLRMLDRAASRHPDRLPDVLADLEPATQHGDPAVRTTAARILRKHATSVTPAIGGRLTAVADATEESVRATADEDRAASRIRFAPAEQANTALPEPPRPPTARPLPRMPVDNAELLTERLAALDPLGWGSADYPWEIALEEVLDGLVRLDSTAADLARLLPRLDRFTRMGALFTERERPALLALAGEVAAGRCGDPELLTRYGIARLRIAELMARLDASPVPCLVAVPTDTSGAIAPPVLLERLSGAETGGWEPWPLDLDQALLRTARSVPPELARSAGTLTSAAGQRLARWWSPAASDLRAWGGLIGVLFSRTSDPEPAGTRPPRSLAPAPHWLAALPHHHEAAARWLSPLLTADDDWGERWLMSQNDDVRLLLGAAGPLGPGLHAVLAHLLGTQSDERRETATAILADLLARPATDSTALGADLGTAFAAGRGSLERAIPGLATVAAARPEQMWPVVAAALPPLMTSRHTRIFRLLEIASDLAGHLGRADVIPGLVEAARGRSKLGQTARELASILSRAG